MAKIHSIITYNLCGRKDVWEVIDKVPSGWILWNIGANAPEGYVPIVYPLDDFNIDLTRLKVIKSDYAEKIMKAASYAATPEEAEKLISEFQNKADLTEIDRHIYDTVSEAYEAMKNLWE